MHGKPVRNGQAVKPQIPISHMNALRNHYCLFSVPLSYLTI